MFRADGLKIYPTLVIRGTGNLHAFACIVLHKSVNSVL